MIEFVLGGARSGKSQYAEQQALLSGLSVIYIATGQAGDKEMSVRIAHHRQRRPDHWLTIEEPVFLASAIENYAASDCYLIVDCLTLWLTNLLFNQQGKVEQQRFDQQTDLLFNCLSNFSGHLIFVSNEVGQGVVAADAMTRRFVDESGFLHQKIAGLSDRVVFMTAGLAQVLKA